MNRITRDFTLDGYAHTLGQISKFVTDAKNEGAPDDARVVIKSQKGDWPYMPDTYSIKITWTEKFGE